MIYLHKLLPLMFSPIVFSTVLIVVGTYKKWRVLTYAAACGLCLLATPVISGKLFRAIESYAVRVSLDSVPVTDGIVVLSGMLTTSPSASGISREWSDPDRFFGGLELFKAAKAPSLIFTRGKLPWSQALESEGDVLRTAAIAAGIPDSAIKLTSEVENTRDEAKAARQLFDSPAPHITLVTSAFHLPRARTVFEREGFTVTGYPVDFKVAVENLTILDFLPDARALYLSDLAIRELIGRAYYAFTSFS